MAFQKKNILSLLLAIATLMACNRNPQLQTEQEIERLCDVGKQHIKLNCNDSAIICFLQAEKLLSHRTDPTLRGRLYSYLGSTWKSKMDYNRSIFYYKQALEAYRQTGNKNKEAWNMLFLGDVLRLQNNQTTESVDYYHKALALNLPNDTLKGNAIQRIGLYYHYKNETDSALHYLKESMKYPYTNREQSVRLLYTGITFYEAQQPDSAEHYLLQALQYSTGIRQKSGCYTMLHQIAADRKDTVNMAHYGCLCKQYSDSISKLETRMSNQLIDIQNQKTAEERTHKIVLAILLAIVTMAFSCTGAVLFFKWINYRKQLKLTTRKKVELEKKLIQSIQREKEQEEILKTKENLRDEIKLLIKTEQGLKLEQNRQKWVRCLRTAIDALPPSPPLSPKRKKDLKKVYAALLHTDNLKAFPRWADETFNGFNEKINRYFDRHSKSNTPLLFCMLLLLEVPQQEADIILEYKNRDSYRNKCKQFCQRFDLKSRDELFPFLIKLMLE